MDERLRAAALEYHLYPQPGKIAVTPTKALTNQSDLSLAYSPGVAAACDEIVRDPATAALYTSRGNLVAVISNGTAVLGLGNIGPLAGKPVMEGKGVLFKKFAGIDVFDIEIAENDPDKLVDIIASLEPTFGGINLEDIKAPECFYVEAKLRERMKIPVFHDDQHGTAIIASAAVLNGLRVVKKDIAKIKLVCSGAGAAAIACLDLLVSLGLDPKNVYAVDSKGVIHTGRENLDPSKARYAQKTDARSLGDAMPDADVFMGLSTADVLKPDMVKTMARDPIILAMANPDPEILPEHAKAVRPDAIIGTGRSDYPNQVNNVLCFPFMFRGALDVGGTGACRTVGSCHRCLRHRRPGLWSGIPDPEAIRSAPDPQGGTGRRPGGDGFRRGHAADRGHGALPRQAQRLRLSHRPPDASGVRRGEEGTGTHRVLRGRGRAHPACRPNRGRRGPGQACPDRAPRGG
jgi:malate dehydrogenase (oxaloacetate-decarboxylating)(NADP+)